MKRLFFLLISALFFTTSFSQQNKLISGPWAGNVGLRTAFIWMEVATSVKKVAVKFYNVNSEAFARNMIDKKVKYFDNTFSINTQLFLR